MATSYAPGELAYLALTSKPELTVRDRLAWTLQTRLAGAVVAREWRNTAGWIDLAVLDMAGHSPQALLELKAAYTFDFGGARQIICHQLPQPTHR
ncbi:hypothetical protein [Streptomyces albogriseolus]|uniref:hypothetical protein n=1 Tax=Streptomyces albogriseolus TaxID=1887 RepID=UPI003D75D932